MWGIEHTLMAAAFFGLCAALLYRGNWAWALAAAMSQMPFWAGSAAYFAGASKSPSDVNAIFDILVAFACVHLAQRLQIIGRDGTILIVMCLLFLSMSVLDAAHMVFDFGNYTEAHEVGHYLALCVIGGRAIVKRVDRSPDVNLRARNPSDGGGVA